jgi:plastocyanin/mono/diheme cytochrome c family protein
MTVPALLIGLQEPPPAARGVRVVEVIARVPEAGGFQPDSITVYAGQRVRLRFRAADVAHGVAVGPGLGIDLGDLALGEVKVVDVTFDQTGTYTFYCNKWCSPHHWRMRGVIAVEHPRLPAPAPQRDPVIDGLAAEGIDIDAYLAPHAGAAQGATGHTATATLEGSTPPQSTPPSALAGAVGVAGLVVPPELEDRAWRRRHTPLEGMARLAAANPGAEADAVADAVAYLWLGGAQAPTAAARSAAATLYAKNCAACHGDSGNGQGFDAGSTPVAPPAFDDAQRMMNRRGDVLYAKIRRGGMGTGMPNFGTLFSPEETWALVDHLWRLALER